jgi:glutathione S-transferase
MYKAIGHVRSRALRVLWMLEELNQEYAYLDYRPGSPEMKAINPSGKVPALEVDGVIITDSVAIMTFLSDKHGQFTNASGSIERAQQDAITHQINDEMDAVLWAAARHSFVLPEEKRVPAVKDSLKWEFARNCGRIAAKMKGEFLFGDQMTLPDILLAHCLNWATIAKFSCENNDLLDHAKRMRSRPAYKRAYALGD